MYKKTLILGLVMLAILVSIGAAGTVCAAAEKTPSGADLMRQLSEQIAEIADRVSPAVVHIASVQIIKMPETSFPEVPRSPFGDDFFDRFFRFHTPRGEYRRHGLGSGVIVSKDGYIVTNNHVVRGADELKVTLSDNKREFDAEVIGTDPDTDLAILKIDADDLPTVELGDSDEIKVGHLVLAIGYPFGLDRTVTFGIVSAKGRAGMGITTYEDFIQTSAAINPGNSGGPLVDLNGKVIGINTAIVPGRRGGFLGIGFAIPSNMVKNVKAQILKGGKVIRGWLGVRPHPEITLELAESLGLEKPEGALIDEVIEGEPADNAGLRHGDVIVEINGKKITDTKSLLNRVAETPPGSEADLVVIRNGKKETFKVTIGERVEEPIASRGRRPREDAVEDLGINVSDVTEELKQRSKIESDEGVVVVRVKQGSRAAQVGLREGAVILEVNRQKAKNVADFVGILREIPKEQNILLWIRYRGAAKYVLIKP